MRHGGPVRRKLGVLVADAQELFALLVAATRWNLEMVISSDQSYKAIYARKLRLYSRSISNFLVSTTLES